MVVERYYLLHKHYPRLRSKVINLLLSTTSAIPALLYVSSSLSIVLQIGPTAKERYPKVGARRDERQMPLDPQRYLGSMRESPIYRSSNAEFPPGPPPVLDILPTIADVDQTYTQRKCLAHLKLTEREHTT